MALSAGTLAFIDNETGGSNSYFWARDGSGLLLSIPSSPSPIVIASAQLSGGHTCSLLQDGTWSIDRFTGTVWQNVATGALPGVPESTGGNCPGVRTALGKFILCFSVYDSGGDQFNSYVMRIQSDGTVDFTRTLPPAGVDTPLVNPSDCNVLAWAISPVDGKTLIFVARDRPGGDYLNGGNYLIHTFDLTTNVEVASFYSSPSVAYAALLWGSNNRIIGYQSSTGIVDVFTPSGSIVGGWTYSDPFGGIEGENDEVLKADGSRLSYWEMLMTAAIPDTIFTISLRSLVDGTVLTTYVLPASPYGLLGVGLPHFSIEGEDSAASLASRTRLLALLYAEQLPPTVRDELEHFVASLQRGTVPALLHPGELPGYVQPELEQLLAHLQAQQSQSSYQVGLLFEEHHPSYIRAELAQLVAVLQR